MRSSISNLITRRIEEMSGTHSQREIARMVGYPNPNNVSMHKRGEAKVPLEKVPGYARVLGVDVGVMFRLWLEQHAFTPETAAMIAANTLTERERQWLELIRKMEAA